MIARLLLLFLFLPSPLWAAITSIGDVCETASTTPGNTLTCTLAAQMDAGNPTLLYIGKDNTGTTDTDHVEVTGVTDTSGNTWNKVCEFTNGQGSAGAGATISLWLTLPTTNLAIGQTITATFSSSITSRAMSTHEYTVGGGNTLQITGACQTLANDAADAGSMAISGLSSAETLFLRAIAQEGQGITVTPTTDYTALEDAQASITNDPTSMSVGGEFRIVTATGSTSDPTLSDTNDDIASIFVAFREVSATPSTRRRIGPVDIN